MSDAEFEKYCFLRLYSIDLDTALQAIRVLKRYRKADVQVALLRDITVIYSRPFSNNRGKEIPKHQLPHSHVPKEFKALHNELVDLRNNQFAHTDLKFHKPRVARFGEKEKPWYPMTFKSFDYGRLLKRLPEIQTLIKSVEERVTSEIHAYEARF